MLYKTVQEHKMSAVMYILYSLYKSKSGRNCRYNLGAGNERADCKKYLPWIRATNYASFLIWIHSSAWKSLWYLIYRRVNILP